MTLDGGEGTGTRAALRARQPFWKRAGFWVGIVAFLLVAFVDLGLHDLEGYGPRAAYAAATTLLMAIWWFTEALPISLTACVPLVLHPLLGVYGGDAGSGLLRAAEPFADAYIFLFLGGMMIGAAMEETRLHRRIALHIMRVIGTDPRHLLLGMLVATASVSLWISNTATAVMMLPIARALIAELEAERGQGKLRGFGAAVMLAVAYACNVGGIGSKIGTGTNSIFAGFVSRELGYEISFLKFLAIGLPFVVVFLPIVWVVLWRLARIDRIEQSHARELLDRELGRMGAMSRPERKVAVVFAAACALWIGSDLLRPLLEPHFPSPWPGFRFELKHYEATVAMAAGLALFAIRALSFTAFLRIPWGTLLLLGGSFAMAGGIQGSGLSTWVAERVAPLGSLPLVAQIFLATLASVVLSAVASNTATITVLLNVLPRSLPVLAATAMGASCDFMLPAGTPPNAIVFGSGYIRLPVMMRTGLVLNIAAVLVISTYATLVLPWLMG